MHSAVRGLSYALTAGLLFVALGALRQSRRAGAGAYIYLAAGLGLLSLVAIAGAVGSVTDYRYRILGDVSLILFLASGYVLLLLRDSFIKLHPRNRIAVPIGLAVIGGWAIAARLPYAEDPHYSSAQAGAVLAVIVAWSACVGQPVVDFWRASKRRPAVQRARLRSLSIAYAELIVILLVAVAVQPARASAFSVAIQATSLLFVPLLYVAISPPGWLRRAWRAPEESALRGARDLVMFAPDIPSLAERALDWATRLVGAEAAVMLDPNGEVVAVRGFGGRADVSERLHVGERMSLEEINEVSSGRTFTVPVRSETGTYTMKVFSGPFAFLFGTDEVERLTQYAETIGLALDRVRLTEQLRALDEAKARFIANAAHELRTPLATIVGYSTLFNDGLVRLSEEEQTQALQAISRQSARMHRLINNLLDLTQIEQGHIRVDPEPVDVQEAIERVLEGAPAPEGRHVRASVGPDLKVWTDRVRFEQILTNLVTNAYRYGGPHVDVRAEAADGRVRIAVSDDGSGVPLELAPHLFEPFRRGVNTQGIEGSGLGLAIVKTLVEALDGTIHYEQAGGARFVIDFERSP